MSCNWKTNYRLSSDILGGTKLSQAQQRAAAILEKTTQVKKEIARVIEEIRSVSFPSWSGNSKVGFQITLPPPPREKFTTGQYGTSPQYGIPPRPPRCRRSRNKSCGGSTVPLPSTVPPPPLPGSPAGEGGNSLPPPKKITGFPPPTHSSSCSAFGEEGFVHFCRRWIVQIERSSRILENTK